MTSSSTGEEYVNLINDRLELRRVINTTEKTLNKLLESKRKLDEEKINYLEEKKNLIEENNMLNQELNDLEKTYKICKICHIRPRLSLNCCSGGLCMECWDTIEAKDIRIIEYDQLMDLSEKKSITRCPYCRQNLPRLVDVLMNVINKNQIQDLKLIL